MTLCQNGKSGDWTFDHITPFTPLIPSIQPHTNSSNLTYPYLDGHLVHHTHLIHSLTLIIFCTTIFRVDLMEGNEGLEDLSTTALKRLVSHHPRTHSRFPLSLLATLSLLLPIYTRTYDSQTIRSIPLPSLSLLGEYTTNGVRTSTNSPQVSHRSQSSLIIVLRAVFDWEI